MQGQIVVIYRLQFPECMCVSPSFLCLLAYLAIVSAERSSGFFTLVSPAGEERKELFSFKDETAKQHCQGTRSHDVG